MQTNRTRRPHGTGTIIEKHGAYYGKWRVGGRQVLRKLGAIRQPGSRKGLTRTQAEQALRRLMGEVQAPPPEQRTTFTEVAEVYLHRLEHIKEREAATIQDYRCMLRLHLGPYFDRKALDRITADDVTRYVELKKTSGGRRRNDDQPRGLATKTILNHLTFAHGVFAFAVKRRQIPANPVAQADRPAMPEPNPDIRFLSMDELRAVIRKVPDDDLGPTDRVLYLAAATTGKRQGELRAMRWRDIGWTIGHLRTGGSIKRSGKPGRPKSQRGYRTMPMTDELAAELERHFQRSAFQADDDYVFCHPLTGNPYDASKIRKRFYEARDAAGVRKITFRELRHTYGTRMAATGTPLRTLQGYMGHRDYKTTEVYAQFAPDPLEGRRLAERAFAADTKTDTNIEATQTDSTSQEPR